MPGGIEEPYTIVQLPRPLDTKYGRILAAPACSLSGSRKRKRHEITVGVDGESINIYNTQNQSLVSSYPLPPQSYLAVPPYSIYRKRAKPLSSRRQTYYAARENPRDQKLRLYSIVEELGKPREDESEPRVLAKQERKLRSGEIIGLDVVDNEDGTTSSVLVSYRNGNLDCLDGDLSEIKWEHTSEGIIVEYGTIVDLATARRGLLKGREDALAILDASLEKSAGDCATPLFLQILRSVQRRQIRISVLRNAVGNSLRSNRAPIKEFLSYDLPTRMSLNDETAEYDLHASTGILYQRMRGHLNIFDLSGTLPRLVAKLGQKGAHYVDSFARLSSTTVLTANSDRLAVCETKFGSILSSLSYPSATSDGTPTPLHIVCHFTNPSLVVSLSGTNLLALQIGDLTEDGGRSKAHEPLLIDVLGKASKLVDGEETKLNKKQLKKRKKWENWKDQVDVLVGDGNILGLEALVAQDLHINGDDVHKDDSSMHESLTNGSARKSNFPGDSIWDLAPHTYDPQHTDQKKALYVLGSLFGWRGSDGSTRNQSSRLQLNFLSRNLLRWLAMAGFMTHTQIEKALQRRGQEPEEKVHVTQGALMCALKDADPSFTTICDLLSLPIHWQLEEVVQGLQVLIRSFEAKSHYLVNGLLTASSNSDATMVNGDNEAQLQAEVDAATRQLDEVQTILDTGLANRSRTCQILLFRLHAFPPADVSRAMRALLSQDELIFFIAILRLELGDAGWTRTYVEAEQATVQDYPICSIDNLPDLEPSNHAVRTIADLCSCAIDAIGLSGWLVGLSGDVDETARLIQETRNEVSAAAEGLVGVEVIDTMLRDIVKTAGSVQQSSHELKRKRPHEEELISEGTMLPLGGRLVPPQFKSWKAQDGFKTKQAIAEEKSRRVGKYSFEQIRL